MERDSLIKEYFLKYKWPYILGIGILVLVDYLQLYIPQITGMVTDGIKDGSISTSGIWTLALALIGVTFLMVIGRIGWRYFIIGTSRKVETDIRHQIFSKWVTLDVPYFNNHKTGNLMAYATNDLNAVRMMVGSGIIIIVDAVVMTILVIVKMFTYVDITLTLLAIFPMFIIAIGGAYFEKRVEERFSDKQRAFAALSDKVQESFSGIKVIKSFVQEYYDIKDFEEISKDNYNKNLRLTKLSAILNPLMYLLIGLSLLISVGYGGYLTMINEITIGEFVAFNQYILMLNWPMMAIAMGINVFAQGIASVKRIEQVLTEVPSVKDNEQSVDIGTIQGNLTIRGLSFDFPDNQQNALKDINLEIKAGETLAILGRTGSGKSTLVNLLLR
ncbi:MAG: ABC transporter transmembrane domain-containing protein, partial [Cellulosilyticaceae bacterium]